mmetsp:Transcript_39133/g.73427  ORF Transcript_39133/g.73427 Transcript_39133/m.73427 type:complete len:89 (-) Transcript_39133:756-1022(-)
MHPSDNTQLKPFQICSILKCTESLKPNPSSRSRYVVSDNEHSSGCCQAQNVLANLELSSFAHSSGHTYIAIEYSSEAKSPAKKNDLFF